MVRNSKGFTIVELMIAMSIFSVTIMLTAAVITGIAKQYQKASYGARLNDASRDVHATVGNALAYGGQVTTRTSNGFDVRCIDDYRYFWKLSVDDVIQSEPGLYRDNKPCGDPAVVSGAENLLPKNGFITAFSITPDATDPLINTLLTTFKVGQTDMFEDPANIDDTYCLPTLRGGDFCSQITYTSTIVKKVGTNL